MQPRRAPATQVALYVSSSTALQLPEPQLFRLDTLLCVLPATKALMAGQTPIQKKMEQSADFVRLSWDSQLFLGAQADLEVSLRATFHVTAMLDIFGMTRALVP